MLCNNCNNKASINYNNIDWCISCFMTSDSKQLASQEIQKEIEKETRKAKSYADVASLEPF